VPAVGRRPDELDVDRVRLELAGGRRDPRRLPQDRIQAAAAGRDDDPTTPPLPGAPGTGVGVTLGVEGGVGPTVGAAAVPQAARIVARSTTATGRMRGGVRRAMEVTAA
jgi:hypothetical protein